MSPPEQILLAGDRVPILWRNGAGTTTDVAASPPGSGLDDFVWRVSIATIDSDSVFSTFAGVDRFLVPLSGDGLDLTVDGVLRHVAQYEACAFPGESGVAATGVARTSNDLNLMVRRGAARGTLVVDYLAGPAVYEAEPGEVVLVIVLDGLLATGGGSRLGVRDAVLASNGAVLAVQGYAVVAVARVS
jgi:hypothetical protein